VNLRFAAGRLLALAHKRRLDGELEGEILAHLEMAELDAIAAGLSPEEARRGFGGIEQMNGFLTFRVIELTLYQSLGNLPEPETTHDFF
jgi:hypothetical protein